MNVRELVQGFIELRRTPTPLQFLTESMCGQLCGAQRIVNLFAPPRDEVVGNPSRALGAAGKRAFRRNRLIDPVA